MLEIRIINFHQWVVNGKAWFWDGGTPFYARLRAMGFHQARIEYFTGSWVPGIGYRNHFKIVDF